MRNKDNSATWFEQITDVLISSAPDESLYQKNIYLLIDKHLKYLPHIIDNLQYKKEQQPRKHALYDKIIKDLHKHQIESIADKLITYSHNEKNFAEQMSDIIKQTPELVPEIIANIKDRIAKFPETDRYKYTAQKIQRYDDIDDDKTSCEKITDKLIISSYDQKIPDIVKSYNEKAFITEISSFVDQELIPRITANIKERIVEFPHNKTYPDILKKVQNFFVASVVKGSSSPILSDTGKGARSF